MFVDTNYNSKCYRELYVCDDTMETCVVEVCFDETNYVIVGVYRPPTDTVYNFIPSISGILNNRKLIGKNVIVIGDLNVDLLQHNSLPVQSFVNEMQSLNFIS